MQGHMMLSRRFAPLFWTQFLAAFNDNFLKNTLVFLILFKLAAEDAASLITLAGAIFIAPFLLLSALGGELADRFDKAAMAERLKLAEAGAAVIAVAGIAFSSIPVLMGALFLFGVGSALFAPVKYGILPDLRDKRELPRANAWVEGATFIAILAGTIVAGVASSGGVSVLVFGPMMIAFAAACWLASRFIPRTGPAAPDLVIDANIFRSTWRLVREIRADTRLWRTALMASWFWLAGAIVMSVLPSMVKNGLGGNEMAVTACLAVFAVSIAVGSGVAAWMSAGRIVLLPAPAGAALMALFGFDLARTIWGLEAAETAATLGAFLAQPGTIRVAVDLAGLAVAGAFVAVPTFTALQAWAPEDRRARVVAAANVLSAGFMALGGGLVAAIQGAGVSIAEVLMGLAVLNGVAAWAMLRFLPTNPFRDFVSILFRAFLRLEIEGLGNDPLRGAHPLRPCSASRAARSTSATTSRRARPVRTAIFLQSSYSGECWIDPSTPRIRLTRAGPSFVFRRTTSRSSLRRSHSEIRTPIAVDSAKTIRASTSRSTGRASTRSRKPGRFFFICRCESDTSSAPASKSRSIRWSKCSGTRSSRFVSSTSTRSPSKTRPRPSTARSTFGSGPGRSFPAP